MSSGIAWGALLALLGGLLAPARARAAEPSRIVFVGIRHKGALSDRAGRAALRRAERMGERLLTQPAPSGAERTCVSRECLARIASARDARWVLGGELRSAGERDYTVSLWMYDATRAQVIEEETSCEACDDEVLGNAVGTTVGKLLDERGHADAPVRAEEVLPKPEGTKPKPGDDPDPPIASRPSDGASTRRPWTGLRIVGTIGLGAALAATLASVLVLSLNDVKGSCPQQPLYAGAECGYNRSLLTAGGVASGLLAAGLVLTVVLP